MISDNYVFETPFSIITLFTLNVWNSKQNWIYLNFGISSFGPKRLHWDWEINELKVKDWSKFSNSNNHSYWIREYLLRTNTNQLKKMFIKFVFYKIVILNLHFVVCFFLSFCCVYIRQLLTHFYASNLIICW